MGATGRSVYISLLSSLGLDWLGLGVPIALMSIGAILLLSILSGVDAANGSRWSRSKEMCFPSAMFALRVFWFLVFGSVAVVVLRPRCSAEGELFCFLPSSSVVACVGGERDLVMAALCMVLADGVFCGGFGTDGFVMVVFLCVGDRFLWMLLCAVEAYGSNGDADLASYYKVAVVWNLGRCCPFIVFVVAGSRFERFAYQLAKKPDWNLFPIFYSGSVFPRGSSSSGVLGTGTCGVRFLSIR